MNPVALALARAAAIAKTRAELVEAFDSAMLDLQFDPQARSVVLGVPEEPARRWARGELTDLDLVLSMDGRNEAIWWFLLPSAEQYFAGLEAARSLFESGARLLIMHTTNPTISAYAQRLGCRVTRAWSTGETLLGEYPVIQSWLGDRPGSAIAGRVTSGAH